MKVIFDLTPKEQKAILQAFKLKDIGLFKVALCNILSARKHGYRDLSSIIEIERPALYLFIKNTDSDTRFSTMISILEALGFTITLTYKG